MKKNWILLVLLSLGLCFAGCEKQPPVTDTDTDTEIPVDPAQSQKEQETLKTRLYVNTFARNYMDLYYLWNAEIAKDLEAWANTDDPIAKVQKIRYKNAKGEDIDKWTMVTDDFDSFYGSVSGTQKTYGFDFFLAMYTENEICAVVTYTYADSPAQEAGLKRGDIILTVNGKAMTPQNYALIYPGLLSGDQLTVGFPDGSTKKITSKEMYENPVLLSKVFNCGSKKVGYLAYTSFTLDSYADLIAACKAFKEAGVSELILDLRYNGGGFVIAEEFLASMLAPEEVVKAGGVLSTEVYNADLTDYFKQQGIDNKTYFKTEYDFKSSDNKTYKFSTADANVGLDKIYAIISSGTASASEAVLCDLYPYMDITLVGEQSHGKYCSGMMLDGEGFYDDYADAITQQMGASFLTEGRKYVKNWGLYVMYSRFADKDGVTRCMPDGLKPDVEIEDKPWDGYQLGDPKETMLEQVLKLCGYQPSAPSSRRSVPAVQPGDRLETAPHRPDFGFYIALPR